MLPHIFPAPNLRLATLGQKSLSSVVTMPMTYILVSNGSKIRRPWQIGKSVSVWPFILLWWKSFGRMQEPVQSKFELLSASSHWELHFPNLVLSSSTTLRNSATKAQFYNPWKSTQCNAFQILSQVLINVQFRPTYWIQLYFLALQLYRLKIGFLGYFQNFKSQFPKVRRVKVIPRTIHYGMREIEIC